MVERLSIAYLPTAILAFTAFKKRKQKVVRVDIADIPFVYACCEENQDDSTYFGTLSEQKRDC